MSLKYVWVSMKVAKKRARAVRGEFFAVEECFTNWQDSRHFTVLRTKQLNGCHIRVISRRESVITRNNSCLEKESLCPLSVDGDDAFAANLK